MEEEHTYENFKEAVMSCDVNPQYEIPSNALATPDKKKPVCSWLWMCALVGFILVGSAAFASLALNISQVNHQSVKIEIEHMIMQLQNTISGLETSVNGSISEYERRIVQLQNSISGLEIFVNGSISEYERRINQIQISIDTSVNVNIPELKRRVMQLQNSIFGLDTTVNGSISEYERRISQLQISVNNLNELQASVSGRIDILLQLNPSASCSHVLQLNPSSPSGHYWIWSSNGSAVRVYCTQMGILPNDSAASCSALFAMYPSSPSGHYWIRSFNGSAVRVYCDFNRQCGCDGPSTWTRVAFLNMSNLNQVCPSNWTTIAYPLRTCGRGNGSCKSTFYSTFGLTYNRVCGRIIAYQDRNTDAFLGLVFASRQIEGPYVDGVSLTHGSVGSREHIWSFASAIGERGPFHTAWLCECSNSNNWPHSTVFVGRDYFCDSGNHGRTIPNIFFSDDPLWDGQGCGSSSTCCQFNNPPWFCKTLPHSTTDDLEVRICNHGSSDDTPIQLLELYVQ